MTRNVGLDNPAERPEDDEFNRWPFSQRLAETIAGFDTSQGAPVLGLFGKWGYGKSTVLNFLRVALERDHGGRVSVFAFNPWLFNDQDALLREFFAGLAKASDVELTKSGKPVGDLMARYGGALSSVPVLGGSLSKTVEAIGKDLSRDPTSEQRERLTLLMRSASRKVVVLIDDLDRLERDEIMTMLKMVRLAANFPNVIYLLAFDEERVGRVAGQAYGEAEGRHFLEKIIQYPFSLPAVGSDRLIAFVVRHARAACREADVDLDEPTWSRFGALCRDVLLGQLGTPRQAIRYANALRFALPMLKGEVDPFDQMIVEAMRVLFPKVYAYVRDNQSFRGQDIPPRLREEEPMAEALIDTLRRWERDTDKPVWDRRYHDRYFSYAVAVDDVSDRELRALLEMSDTDDQAGLDARVRELARTRLGKLVERLSAEAERLTLHSAHRLALALARSGDLLPAENGFYEQARAATFADLIARFADHHMVLQDMGNFRVAGRLMECATPLPLALVIFVELGRVEYRRLASDTSPSNSALKHDWDSLRAALGRRIATEAAARTPYGSYHRSDALQLLRFWHAVDPAAQKAWLEQRLAAHPEEIVSFLRLFEDKLLTFKYIAEMVDPALVARSVQDHLGDALWDRTEHPEFSDVRSFLDAFSQASNSQASNSQASNSQASNSQVSKSPE